MRRIQEFIQALEDEIKFSAERTFKLEEGTLQSTDNETCHYSFKAKSLPDLRELQTFELQVEQKRYECSVLNIEKNIMEIGVACNLGELLGPAILLGKKKQLLENLIERLAKVDKNTCRFADEIFSGRSQALREEKDPQFGFDPALPPNASQIRAIKKSLNNSLAVIWGPPGTGKTRTIARLAEAHLREGRRVLLVAHANTALDAAMEDVAAQLASTFYRNKKLLRIGMMPNAKLLKSYPLLYVSGRKKSEEDKLRAHNDAIRQKVKVLEQKHAEVAELGCISDQVRNLEKQQKQLILEQAQEMAGWEFQLSCAITQEQAIRLELEKYLLHHSCHQFDTLLQAAHERLQVAMERSGSANDIEAKLQAVKGQIKALTDEFRVREDDNEDFYEPEDSARLIGATITQVFLTKVFERQAFDVVIVDEASMVSLPQLYWVLTKAKLAATICGDFKQLPPVVKASTQAANKWLKRTIFDLLDIANVKCAGSDPRVAMLDSQYRMFPSIAQLASNLFYGGRLLSAPSTAELVLSDGISGTSPLILVDTARKNPAIVMPPEGSRKNLYSAQLCLQLCAQILEEDPKLTVGIVSPYRLQVNHLQKLWGKDDRVTIDTVHKFQGSEARIIIFDSVDGPGSISCMLDSTGKNSNAAVLLNVALTRARSKFYMIANCSYFRQQFAPDNLICRFLDEMEKLGTVIQSDCIDGSYAVDPEEQAVAAVTNHQTIHAA